MGPVDDLVGDRIAPFVESAGFYVEPWLETVFRGEVFGKGGSPAHCCGTVGDVVGERISGKMRWISGDKCFFYK